MESFINLIEKTADFGGRTKIQFGDIDINEAYVYAAEHGFLNSVKFFVRNGCNIGYQGDQALKQAAKNGHVNVLSYLSRLIYYNLSMLSFTETILSIAIAETNMPVLKYVLQTRHIPSEQHYQLLLTHSQTPDSGIAKCLAENVPVCGNQNELFTECVKRRDIKSISYLVEHGFNLSDMALVLAISLNAVDVVNFLIGFGCRLTLGKKQIYSLMYRLSVSENASERRANETIVQNVFTAMTPQEKQSYLKLTTLPEKVAANHKSKRVLNNTVKKNNILILTKVLRPRSISRQMLAFD
jgi:hypothetical protein